MDSFYPIFPVPLDLAHEVNLDVTHSELLNIGPSDDEEDETTSDPSKARCAPDVLVIPSRLKQFSKVCVSCGAIATYDMGKDEGTDAWAQVVDNTVVINPSFLTKSTYAVLEYAGHASPGPARDRLKVEIDRLEG